MKSSEGPAETRARVRGAERVARASWLFTLEPGPEFPQARPGQFVQLEAPGHFALRRPFSVAGAPDGREIELLIEVRGDATRALTALRRGAEVGLTGPLGRPFDRHPEGRTAALIAGGIGVAGLRFLAQELTRNDVPIVALVGARSADRLLDGTLPRSGSVRIERATDDATAGFAGSVCALFAVQAPRLPDGSHVYLCGPRAMIDIAGRTALDRGFGASALLEETMACGVGACRGCIVATRHGYRAVCSDGPVFDVRDLIPECAADA